jgi:hypothetical protein
MRFKEVDNFILEKGMKMKRLPRLFESGPMNPPMMGPCVSSPLLSVYR